jgi:hypothetical protein
MKFNPNIVLRPAFTPKAGFLLPGDGDLLVAVMYAYRATVSILFVGTLLGTPTGTMAKRVGCYAALNLNITRVRCK